MTMNTFIICKMTFSDSPDPTPPHQGQACHCEFLARPDFFYNNPEDHDLTSGLRPFLRSFYILTEQFQDPELRT